MDAIHLPSALVQPPKGRIQRCSLCGFQFDSAKAACSGCVMLGGWAIIGACVAPSNGKAIGASPSTPLRGCSKLKCPNCHYEFVAESKIANWFQKLFGKGN